MRIGLVANNLTTSKKTGVEKYAYNLIENILNLDKKNEYFLIHYGKVEGICAKEIIRKSRFTFGLENFYDLRKANLDIIHELDGFAYQSFFLIPKLAKKTVLQIHDLTTFTIPQIYKHSSLKMILNRLMMSEAIKRKDLLITDSENTSLDVIKYFKIPENKMAVVYPAVDKSYHPLESNIIEEFMKTKRGYIGKKYILYVGRIENRKNLITLIKAFSRLKKRGLEHKLVIIGPAIGPESKIYFKQLCSTVENLSINKDVLFLGYVPENELALYYCGADLFVYIPIYEGFGIPPLEAMACGTPVITSNTSSLPELVGDEGIMVNPFDIDGLSETMVEIINNESLRQKIITIGLKRAALFTWRNLLVI